MIDPKIECEDLLNEVLPIVVQMLEQHREFYPAAVTMSEDGAINHASAWTGSNRPQSTEEMQLLKDGFRQRVAKGELKAIALAYDILTVPPGKSAKQDAVAINLDHREDYSVVVVFPYSFSTSGSLVLEESFATIGDGEIFQ